MLLLITTYYNMLQQLPDAQPCRSGSFDHMWRKSMAEKEPIEMFVRCRMNEEMKWKGNEMNEITEINEINQINEINEINERMNWGISQ